MKLVLKSGLVLGLVMSLSAMADHKEGHEGHPGGACKKIVEACKTAGFTRGGHKEGKGLWKDCVQNIVSGKAVAGVTVEASDVEACKAKKANHQAKKEAKKEAK